VVFGLYLLRYSVGFALLSSHNILQTPTPAIECVQ
jgi:hypothetical protein